MKIKPIIFIYFLVILGCKNSEEKTVIREVNFVNFSMDKNANSLLLDGKINSVSIGVYKDGRKYTSHYGELDKGKGNQPTDKTMYEIASVSKTFTGVLVARSVLEERIMLNDDIREYLNEDYSNFEYDDQPILIKHLLTHTSGMPKFLPESISQLFSDFNESLPFKVHKIQKQYSKQNFFEDLHRVILDTIPGAKYSYSNVDTELMAKILENVYKKPFDKILTEYFKNNGSLVNTHINLPEDRLVDLANGYGMTNKIVPHEIVMFGADGGVKTTMPDLVNYMELQLDTTNQVIKESHRVLDKKKNRAMSYYWSVRKNEEYGTFLSMHGGGFGSQNWFFIFPEHNLGISVITNQSDLDTADKLMKTVRGLIKDLK